MDTLLWLCTALVVQGSDNLKHVCVRTCGGGGCVLCLWAHWFCHAQVPILVDMITTPFKQWGGPFDRSDIYEEKKQAALVRCFVQRGGCCIGSPSFLARP